MMKGKPCEAFGRSFNSISELAKECGVSSNALINGGIRNNITPGKYAEKSNPEKVMLIHWQRFTLGSTA